MRARIGGKSALSKGPHVLNSLVCYAINKLYSFTEKYFSPVIIDKEFDRVQIALAEEQFQDERLEIKILRPAREILVRFTIDEQVMEIVVRVPLSFPLKQAEIDGARRVGVKENQYRSWLLASQSTLTSQVFTLLLKYWKNHVC